MTYYHGTDVVFNPGDIISPGHKQNFAKEHPAYRNDRVFVTNRIGHARLFADRVALRHNDFTLRTSHVYEVEPEGLAPDSEHPEAQFTATKAKVIREVVPSEFRAKAQVVTQFVCTAGMKVAKPEETDAYIEPGTRLFHVTRRAEEIKQKGLHPSRMGESGPGLYTTPDESFAKKMHYDEGFNTIHLTTQRRLRMLNRDTSAGEKKFRDFQGIDGHSHPENTQQRMKDAGYDGIVWQGLDGNSPETVIHDPSSLRVEKVAFGLDEKAGWLKPDGTWLQRAQRMARGIQPIAAFMDHREVFYHASQNKMPLGTVLVPQGEGGRVQNFKYHDEFDPESMSWNSGQKGKVFMATVPDDAIAYAGMGDHYRRGAPTFIYEVVPIGAVADDESDMMGTAYSAEGARVVRRGVWSNSRIAPDWDDEQEDWRMVAKVASSWPVGEGSYRVKVNPRDLKPHRQHDRIRESISTPHLVLSPGHMATIVDGNHALNSAIERGDKSIEVIVDRSRASVAQHILGSEKTVKPKLLSQILKRPTTSSVSKPGWIQAKAKTAVDSWEGDATDWGSVERHDFNTNRGRGDWNFYERQHDLDEAGMPQGRKFNQKDAQRYVQQVVDQRLGKGMVFVNVEVLAGGSTGSTWVFKSDPEDRVKGIATSLTRLPEVMATDAILLHETAHIIARFKDGSWVNHPKKKPASHGDAFSSDYAELLYNEMGSGFGIPNFTADLSDFRPPVPKKITIINMEPNEDGTFHVFVDGGMTDMSLEKIKDYVAHGADLGQWVEPEE